MILGVTVIAWKSSTKPSKRGADGPSVAIAPRCPDTHKTEFDLESLVKSTCFIKTI
jgi:hypothetical protein